MQKTNELLYSLERNCFMIHIIHGEFSEGSRRELAKLREKFSAYEIIQLDGKSVTQTDIVVATESESLFATKRLVLIERFLSQFNAKKAHEVSRLKQQIERLPKDVEIVFWEEKEISRTILALFPKDTDIALFKPDRSLFSFVEALRPGNNHTLIGLYQTSLRVDSPEMIFAMLVRQLRCLIMAKEMGKGIPKISPWQAGKLTKQAEFFSDTQLHELYRKLLNIDVKIKFGLSAYNLEEALKIFVLSM